MTHRRRAARALALLVTLGVVAAAGFWAGRTAIDPPAAAAPPTSSATYVVVQGTVGRTIDVSALASWSAEATMKARRPGIVTKVRAAPGAVVAAGQALVEVDGQPIVIARGATPAYRDLTEGVRSEDVRQAQGLLGGLGFYKAAQDGAYTADFAEAVKAWQRSVGLPATGVVRAGDVAFVEQLPARVRLAVAVGDDVAPGASLGDVLAPAPSFAVPVSEDQLAVVPLTSDVTVRLGGAEVRARVRRVVRDGAGGQPGQPSLQLAGAGDDPLCGEHCSEVPVVGQTPYAATITVVPPTSGSVVPTAALSTDAGSAASVLLADGPRRAVTVVQSADGLSVVRGLRDGEVVVLPTADGTAPASP